MTDDVRLGRAVTREVGDTKTVDALPMTQEDAADEHGIELTDQQGRTGFVWHCDRCMVSFYDHHKFENEPCIPWRTND